VKINDFKDDVFIPRLWIDCVTKGGLRSHEADDVCLDYVSRFRDPEKPVVSQADIHEAIQKVLDESDTRYDWDPEFDDDEDETPQTH